MKQKLIKYLQRLINYCKGLTTSTHRFFNYYRLVNTSRSQQQSDDLINEVDDPNPN